MNPPLPIATVRVGNERPTFYMGKERVTFYPEGGIGFERDVRGIGWVVNDDPSQLMSELADRLQPNLMPGCPFHDMLIELLGSLLHQLGTDSDLDEIAGAAKYDRLEEQVRDVLELLDPTHPSLQHCPTISGSL
ncbi:MAG: hypothetical protein IID44_10285 [Planctomycetes bacterium]|nr:hypothetical protein [Planctomycetota bacterium]